MSELFSLASGTNHNVCQYCDYNHKSECPCCTSLGFEGFSLNEHDKQVRADAIDEFIKGCKTTHDGLICNWDKPYGITFERMEEKAKELKEQKDDD